jgi:hypothetical protein
MLNLMMEVFGANCRPSRLTKICFGQTIFQKKKAALLFTMFPMRLLAVG